MVRPGSFISPPSSMMPLDPVCVKVRRDEARTRPPMPAVTACKATATTRPRTLTAKSTVRTARAVGRVGSAGQTACRHLAQLTA